MSQFNPFQDDRTRLHGTISDARERFLNAYDRLIAETDPAKWRKESEASRDLLKEISEMEDLFEDDMQARAECWSV